MEEDDVITAGMGWIGTIGGIAAYVMLSRGTWQATSLRYCLLNAVAGLLAASASAVYGAWPSVVSNLLWAGIAVHVALRTRRERRSPRLASVEPLRREYDDEPPTGPQPTLLAA